MTAAGVLIKEAMVARKMNFLFALRDAQPPICMGMCQWRNLETVRSILASLLLLCSQLGILGLSIFLLLLLHCLQNVVLAL